MGQSLSILDKDYLSWIKELSSRYRRGQIKAAVKVNEEMLRFYWELGRDIVEHDAENKYGSSFYTNLSRDLRNALQTSEGLSERNLRYTKKFYQLYTKEVEILQQVAAKSEDESTRQPNNQILQQVAANSESRPQPMDIFFAELFSYNFIYKIIH